MYFDFLSHPLCFVDVCKKDQFSVFSSSGCKFPQISINLSYLIKKKSLRPRELHQKEKVLEISDVTLQTCGVPFPYVRFPHARSFYSTTLFDSDPKKIGFMVGHEEHLTVEIVGSTCQTVEPS